MLTALLGWALGLAVGIPALLLVGYFLDRPYRKALNEQRQELARASERIEAIAERRHVTHYDGEELAPFPEEWLYSQDINIHNALHAEAEAARAKREYAEAMKEHR